MKSDEILEFFVNDIHHAVVSAVSGNGQPVSTVVDLLLLKDHKIYFMVAKGNDIYDCLQDETKITLTGVIGKQMTEQKSVSLSGQVRNIKQELQTEILENNEYLKKIFVNEKALNVLEVFEMYRYQGEYLDLTQTPIYRKNFCYDKANETTQFLVTKRCIYCKACLRVCPQRCIDITVKPVRIQNEHCLKCGKCAEICPRQAIEKSKSC